MNPEQVRVLRREVIAYYDSALSAPSFGARLRGVLDTSPTILVNDEGHTTVAWRRSRQRRRTDSTREC
jgi:hypothetical protein